MSSTLHKRKTRPSSCVDLLHTMKSSNMISTEMGKPQQTDLFKGLYKGRAISDQQQSKLKGSQTRFTYRGSSMDLQDIIKLKTKCEPRTSKTAEQLLQQNKQLKITINQLKQQISKLKVQLNLSNKRYESANEAMMENVDYYKDIYWPKDLKSHRIYGMKQQYQKLKKQYVKQKAECQQLKLQLTKSGQTELVIYTKQLQNENKRLQQIIKFNELKVLDSPNANQRSQKKQTQQINNLSNVINDYKRKVLEKDNKLLFLQKVVIQKDNKQNSFLRKQRKYQKIIKQLEEKIDLQLQSILFLQKKQLVQSIRSRSRFQEQLRTQKKIWKKIVKQKDNKINQLEDNLKSLEQTIIKNKSIFQSKHNFTANHARKLSTQFGNNLLLAEQLQLKSETRRFSSQYNQEPMIFQHIANFSDRIPRSPKKAVEKISQKCLKLKKVQLITVQPIGDLLRYRMIALAIPVNQMKEYFTSKIKIDGNKQSSNKQMQCGSQKYVISSKSEQIQKKKLEEDFYINMKQVQEVLRSFPFSLQNQQNFVLARYLIEDGNQQFVYCDQSNENRRQVVKSILKAVVGEYQPIKEGQLAIFLQSFNKKCGPNLKSALQNYEPSGKISKQKFVQVVKSIESGITESQLQMLIGRMSLSSSCLSQMNYNYLFQQI